ncbi:MAG: 4-(cytidine 5'-diphospho)-2-C-methyl-D-erythritol kinase [Clostridia bacterium]|nr:4-(cytidine 5'-diphospho)-2-C-methyl-D-erythritol kinase [Clostridia bacterium]
MENPGRGVWGQPKTVRLEAPAKINLCLAVTGRRDGYHLLDTVMQEVDLCDSLEIEMAEKTEVLCLGGQQLPNDNTAAKAAQLFFQESGITGGARIRLWKRIPAQAGLGGGSSDGTAVLHGLNQLCGEPLTDAELGTLALRIGADCPFFLRGGTQRARGIGEQLIPVRNRCHFHFLLVKPDEGVPTAQAFALADSLPPLAVDTEACVRALEAGSEEAYFSAAGNALEPAARQIVPEIGRLGALCLELGAGFWQMSGSGSCLFAAFADDTQRQAAFQRLSRERHLFVLPVETV